MFQLKKAVCLLDETNNQIRMSHMKYIGQDVAQCGRLLDINKSSNVCKYIHIYLMWVQIVDTWAFKMRQFH